MFTVAGDLQALDTPVTTGIGTSLDSSDFISMTLYHRTFSFLLHDYIALYCASLEQ